MIWMLCSGASKSIRATWWGGVTEGSTRSCWPCGIRKEYESWPRRVPTSGRIRRRSIPGCTARSSIGTMGWERLMRMRRSGMRKKLVHLMALQPNIALRQLHDLRCPALIIGGDNDVILPEHTMQIARAIPRSYLRILPNSGHSTLVHYSAEFNRIVMDFLKSHIGGSGTPPNWNRPLTIIH